MTDIDAFATKALLLLLPPLPLPLLLLDPVFRRFAMQQCSKGTHAGYDRHAPSLPLPVAVLLLRARSLPGALLCTASVGCWGRGARLGANSRTDAASVMAPDAADAPTDVRKVSKHTCSCPSA